MDVFLFVSRLKQVVSFTKIPPKAESQDLAFPIRNETRAACSEPTQQTQNFYPIVVYCWASVTVG